jgi:multicomponent Na+:H+ antiporter subunit A
MELVAAVLAGFVVACIAPWISRIARGYTGWVIALVPLAITVYLATLIGRVADGDTIRVAYNWAPSLDLYLSFYVDGLSLLFALLISGIGTIIMVYAGGYMAGHHQLGRFYVYLLMFMGSMLGVVLSDNLITFFVFWELTSISSYFLIGFNHEDKESRASALQALLITAGGGLALLPGLLLMGQIGGSYEFSELLVQGDVFRDHAYYVPILLLVLAGAFTKSAQFPFHIWLPNAMAAPTPVSAYLHSATMVKAGIYLLARTSPVLSETSLWQWLVGGAGFITLVLGAYLAFPQKDLKRLLAYSTISALGTLVFLLGLNTPLAIKAAIVYLLVHSLYKGSLFLVAGIIDHETGTRNVDLLRGLRKSMPITAAVAILAALSMASLPPLFGFIGHEIVYEAIIEEAGFVPRITAIGVVLSSIILFSVAGIVGVAPFLGSRGKTPKAPHEAPVSLWVGPAILAAFGLVLGIIPTLFVGALLEPAVSAAAGVPVVVDLKIWHGINPALILSGITTVIGIGLFLGRGRIQHVAVAAYERNWPGPEMAYRYALLGLNFGAKLQTRILQSGYLRYYLLTLIIAGMGAVGYTLLSRGELVAPPGLDGLQIHEMVIAIVILMATIVVVLIRSRLAAILALGVIGYGVATIFILFGAPDLAMAQVLVETLTVILLVLVFYHLPRFAVLSSKRSRLRDAVIALTAGAVVTSLVLIASSVQFDPPISDFYVQASAPEAHGRNIVNVILVDFRALDTLGEITVLALAGLGVYSLLKLRISGDVIRRAAFADSGTIVQSIILQTLTRLMLPLLLLFSIFLLLRGHNEPGGGFTGGLVAASAFALFAIAFSVPQARKALRFDPHIIAGFGLLVAFTAGIMAVFTGDAFLTGLWWEVHIPFVGEVDLNTPLLFDTGVYLVVVGVTLMIVLSLGEE